VALNNNELSTAYRMMKTIREFEMRIAKEYATGVIPGMTHLYIGQEAVATGVCMHLGDEDYIASTHRGHGHCIAKGCDIEGMALELYRKAGGLCKGKGGSMHIADISKGMLGANAIVGGAPPLAIGAALSAKTKGNNKIGLAFLGEGAANQGTTFEAMNMAVVLKLPAIFIIENNGYGEHTGADYASGNDLTVRTNGFGIPTVKVDGTDVFAVYEAMEVAVQRARTGGGPSAIEAMATRWHGHYEGDPQLYRDKAEIEATRKNEDPLVKFRDKVLQDKSLKSNEMGQIDKDIAKLINAAIDKAALAPDPAPEELLTDVYETY